MESSPTARALVALELIQNVPGISGERLGQRLGVTDRAARRYVGILREAGIPIESATGRFGGYRLGRGYRIPPLMFSPAEALGLVMAALEGRPSGSEPDDPVGAALSKIIRVLPAASAQRAEALRQVSAAPAEAPTASPDPEIAAALVRGSSLRRRVRLDYALRDDRTSTMEVDPWAVSIRRGRWYLLCWSHAKAARRVLRVDRVARVDVLLDTFVAPDDLDPVQVIEEHLADTWAYEVEVVIDAPAADAAAWIPRSLGRLEPIDADHTRLLGTTDEPYWYCIQLLQIRAPIHVVRPAELREAARFLGAHLQRAAGDTGAGAE